jgi:hypothetical protein
VPTAAKTAVSMHAMATRRKNTSIAVSDGSRAGPIGRTMPPARAGARQPQTKAPYGCFAR